MQNNEQSLLLTHRENYNVPKGQEHTVHCKIAKLDSNGNFLEGAKIIHVGVKKFETCVKDNLENMGYTIEILYHPMGRYSNVVIKDKDVELAVKNAEINALKAELETKGNDKALADKDAEIARLKAELEETKKKVAETANPTESAEEKKKGGRPRKED